MDHKNMTLDQYTESLKYDLARFGFTDCPLSKPEIEACYLMGFPLHMAYSIACDVNAGYSFIESAILAQDKESI